MQRSHLIFVLILLVLFSASILGAEDPFEKLNKDYEAQVKAMQRQYEDQRLDMEKQWAALEKEQDETWARLKAEAERKWQAFVHSTKKDWVDYNPDKDSRSKVDFKS